MNEKNILKKLEKLLYKSIKRNEIPVSALIVQNNKIISSSYNKKEQKKDITAHAEVLAIKKAAKKLKRWNLNDCILYVSLKPCKMCEEIIKQSRIEKVYYFLEKPLNKKEFSKTNMSFIEHKNFMDTYQHLLSNFFKKMR